jgi:hypothetical protein
MADTAYKVEHLGISAGNNIIVVSWLAMPKDNLGVPWCSAEYPDKTVHIRGTFDAGTVTIEGTNELIPVNYIGLADPQGTAISQGIAGIEAILENPLWIRPRVTGGGAACAIDVIMVARRNIRRLG